MNKELWSVLENWKKTDNRYPLIIKGARQIGKTEAIEHFAKNHYKSIIEIQFCSSKTI